MYHLKQTILILLLTPLSIFTIQAQKSFQKNIFFGAKQSQMNEDESLKLYQLIDTLDNFETYSIALFGSSELGISNSKTQSSKRIKAISDYLVKNGIPKEKISMAIESESNSVNIKLSENEKALSRRVEIVVNYKEIEKDLAENTNINNDSITSIIHSQSNDYGKNEALNKTEIQKIYEQLADKPTVVKVKISKTSTTKIVGSKGTVLLLPNDAFDVPEGSEVTFTLKEAYKISDMLLENLTTQSGNQTLVSGGMVNIKATLDGKEIQPNKPFDIMIPKDKNNPMRDSMRLFDGASNNPNNIDWR